MKNLLAIVFGSVLLSLSSGAATQAAVLGTQEFSNEGGNADIFKDYQLTLTIGSASDRYPSNAPIFDGIKVTPADVGRTFTVTADTDSDFNGFVSFLTDGKPDGMQLNTGSGASGSSGGGLGVSGNLFGGSPDLAGNKIDSISMRINSFTLNSPGINPNGDGKWTDQSFDATLIVEGEPLNQHSATDVPEPSSTLGMLLFGAFGSGLMMQRLRSR